MSFLPCIEARRLLSPPPRRVGSMPLDAFFDRLRKAPDLGPNVVRWHREPAREGVTADFPDWTPPCVRDAFVRVGIERLWSHQREAAEHVYAGRHVAVVTPTAS